MLSLASCESDVKESKIPLTPVVDINHELFYNSDSLVIAKKATGMSFKLGLFHEFIPNNIRWDKRYSIKLP